MAEKIRDLIAEALVGISPRIESEIVDIFVDREVNKKREAFVQVMDKLIAAENEMKKLGADNVTFDAEGKKTSESFSKKRIEERNKTKGKIQKFINVLNKAIEKNDWSDVLNLASGKDSGQDKSGADAEATADTD